MRSFKIICVVGARPNFMKIALLMREFKNYPEIEAVLVHTGQHFDTVISKLFFKELEIPAPHVNLEVGSGSHAIQTAKIMDKFEPILMRGKPDLIIVVGDVNSTLVCALTSVKLQIPVTHVGAGLKSLIVLCLKRSIGC